MGEERPQTPPSEKRCGTCKDVLPVFAFGKDAHRKDGLYASCKSCVCQSRKRLREMDPERYRGYKRNWGQKHRQQERAANQLYYQSHPRLSVPPPERKMCSACGREKPGADFYPKAGSADGLCGRCKVCYLAKHRLYQREYYAKNREHCRAVVRAWKERNADLVRRHRFDYYQVHREERRAANRAYYMRTWERRQEYAREYQRTHRHLSLDYGWSEPDAWTPLDRTSDNAALDPTRAVLHGELARWCLDTLSASEQAFLSAYVDADCDLAAAADEVGLSEHAAQKLLRGIQTRAAQEFEDGDRSGLCRTP